MYVCVFIIVCLHFSIVHIHILLDHIDGARGAEGDHAFVACSSSIVVSLLIDLSLSLYIYI